MYDKDFAELVKIAAEKLKEDTVYKMLTRSEDCPALWVSGKPRKSVWIRR